MTSTMDNPWADWIGRATQDEEVITPRMVESYRATLAPHLAPVGPGNAPLALHWCLMPAIEPMDRLGADGHPERGGFLPPVPLPRRMWAGGEIETFDALRTGDHVLRRSVIKDVSLKQGRSGALCFVQVEHVYSTGREMAIRERHDIVYRDAPDTAISKQTENPVPAGQAEPACDLCWTLDTTSTLLFRYSALTFNGHRIHYDHPYAIDVEGYQGLVVHGPLQASLLFNQAAALKGQVPDHFTYRARSPVIAGNTIKACSVREVSGDIRCWTQTASGLSMEASARWT